MASPSSSQRTTDRRSVIRVPRVIDDALDRRDGDRHDREDLQQAGCFLNALPCDPFDRILNDSRLMNFGAPSTFGTVRHDGDPPAWVPGGDGVKSVELDFPLRYRVPDRGDPTSFSPTIRLTTSGSGRSSSAARA